MEGKTMLAGAYHGLGSWLEASRLNERPLRDSYTLRRLRLEWARSGDPIILAHVAYESIAIL
jgi:hypothetical protein